MSCTARALLSHIPKSACSAQQGSRLLARSLRAGGGPDPAALRKDQLLQVECRSLAFGGQVKCTFSRTITTAQQSVSSVITGQAAQAVL